MDNENESASGPQTAQADLAHMAYPTIKAGDVIADRTGELLESAVHTAERLVRVEVGSITDPRDGTLAHIVVGKDGVRSLAPECFDEYRKAPVRRSGTSSHTRVDSFIAAVNRFKSGDSAIFADENPASPRLTAVFDYHPEGPARDNADFGDHRATYAFPLSPEWQAWFGQNGKPLSMVEFAAFLEDHIVDVLQEPGALTEAMARFVSTTGGKFATPSNLIELSRGLQVYENSVVKETRNLSSGEAELTFDTQHTDADGKPLKLPNMFVIAIPVFKMSDISYRLIARLRYRKQGGALAFWYELWRADLVFTDAFEEAVGTVREQTGLPVFHGAPEA